MTAAVLPPAAATIHTVYSKLVVMVRNNCRGHWPVFTCDDADAAAMLVAAINTALGVTPPQREALFAGSMFGHDCPAADPSNYDERGHILHH